MASLNFIRYVLPCHQRAARAKSRHTPSDAPTPAPMAVGSGPVHSPSASGGVVVEAVEAGTGQEEVADGIINVPILGEMVSSQQSFLSP